METEAEIGVSRLWSDCEFDSPLSSWRATRRCLWYSRTVMRDEFSEQTKRSLALRVGYRCSRPECGAPTVGPQDEPSKVVSVGVAAHITAASASGPRYDPSLSAEERVAPANGIWLCQNCAKLIDSDLGRFAIEVLQRWKIDREAEARRQIGLAGGEQSRRGVVLEFYVGELVERGVGRSFKFIFKVANPNERPVTIWGGGVEAPEHGISVPVMKPEYNPLPQQITDGNALMFMSSIDHFVSELRRRRIPTPVQIIGYVTDALGGRYKSKPVEFPLRTSG